MHDDPSAVRRRAKAPWADVSGHASSMGAAGNSDRKKNAHAVAGYSSLVQGVGVGWPSLRARSLCALPGPQRRFILRGAKVTRVGTAGLFGRSKQQTSIAADSCACASQLPPPADM